MSAIQTAEPLSPDQAQRLTDFARACKAAVRIVALYPATHPVIRSGLQRVAETSQRLRASGNATLTVFPDSILLDGHPPTRPDSALHELATLLHSHLIGELGLLGELPEEGWHAFLSLVARPPEEVRAEGGIGRAWMAVGGGPIEIRQIDYSEVLRERSGGSDAEWDRLIANYLEGELSDLDDAAMSALFDIAGDQSRFKDFTERLVTQATEGGRRGKKEIVLRILQALADYVARTNPDQLDRILRQIAGVLPQLTPDMAISLITTGAPHVDGATGGIDLPGEVRARISDHTIAEFVAQSVSRDNGATNRLAQAFQALVPDEKHRELLDMAQEELANMPIGRQPEFSELWKSTETLLTTYSDANFVSEEYAKELSTARSHAIEVERVSDDPPERIGSWLSTVSDPEVRKLDQQLVLDLLQIETREDAWRKVLTTAIELIDQLVLSGNVVVAQPLLDRLVASAAEGQPFVQAARDGLDQLRAGPLMKHVVLFVRQAHDSDVGAATPFCRTLGPGVIAPLVEALTNEQSSATVRRLREILLSFGAAGKPYADSLRTSANPAVRRTAIELLRAFGGAEALPDLAALLNDSEPAVQREALRAIIQIGTDDAYAALLNAMRSGTTGTRDVIMQVVGASRHERAAPLIVYILEHTNFRGPWENVYVSAIDALGKVGSDAESVAVLKRLLYRGDWWAPFRTGRLRAAAARALWAIGSDEAHRILDEATHGPRGVRRAARAAMTANSQPAPRRPS